MPGHPKDAPPSDTKIIEERSIDHARPMRVVVIGSGLSGIIASIRLRQRVPNLDLCIYEKNDDVGGTWLENRYPGCACGMLSFLLSIVSDNRQDIPAHTYHASFEPNKEWSTFYAAAPEIHKYWKRVVDKYGCMEYVRLRSQVTEAVWNEERGKWQLKVGIQPDGQYRTSY
jgi:cation diffusion facilitator CzcD-associated flavoprotein CzcO